MSTQSDPITEYAMVTLKHFHVRSDWVAMASWQCDNTNTIYNNHLTFTKHYRHLSSGIAIVYLAVTRIYAHSRDYGIYVANAHVILIKGTHTQ